MAASPFCGASTFLEISAHTASHPLPNIETGMKKNKKTTCESFLAYVLCLIQVGSEFSRVGHSSFPLYPVCCGSASRDLAGCPLPTRGVWGTHTHTHPGPNLRAQCLVQIGDTSSNLSRVFWQNCVYEYPCLFYLYLQTCHKYMIIAQ